MEKLCSYCVHLLLAFSGRSDRIFFVSNRVEILSCISWIPGNTGQNFRCCFIISGGILVMKKILVIGSAVVDVVINLDHLPQRSEDVHVLS